MPSNAAYRLKDLIKGGGGGGDRFPSKFFAVVDAVLPDGSVDLHWGGNTIPAVPAGSGYPPWMRKAGDKVAVEVYDGGDLLVTTSAGTNEYPPGMQPTAEARLGWGAEEPGPDWSQASSVFLRKLDDRPAELYALTKPGEPENPIEADGTDPETGDEPDPEAPAPEMPDEGDHATPEQEEP